MKSKASTRPAYLALAESGELPVRRDKAQQILRACTLCPHQCGVNRLAGSREGICKTACLAPVASYSAHFGEEEPLVGQYGSGTVFFGSCNLLCSFCQNHEISHHGETGCTLVSDRELAAIFLALQAKGCHNINLVTPTHCVPQIISALTKAVKQGLNIPLVYNSSGYETRDTLALLDNIIDIYMPDFKFWENKTAARYTAAEDYGDRARAAVKIMYQQVGDLLLDENGIATRGLLVRHLVMPGMADEAIAIIRFLSREISTRCAINLMDQYRPCNGVGVPIDRPVSAAEYRRVIDAANTTALQQLNGNTLLRLLKKLGLL